MESTELTCPACGRALEDRGSLISFTTPRRLMVCPAGHEYCLREGNLIEVSRGG